MKSILSLSTSLGQLKLGPNDSERNDSATPETELPDNVQQLNNSLYEFHTPGHGKTPNVEVIFFHGLQAPGDVSKAYLHTWKSTHGGSSFYWPQKLLPEDFPSARILSVSYDSCTTRGLRDGITDIYQVAENLLQDFTQKERGHRSGCPVILVGKDIGGLVIKAICVAADRNRTINESIYKSFLHDIQGILYYSTPQHGFKMSRPSKFDGAMFQNLGFQDASLARVSHEFNGVNRSFKWQTRAVIGILGKESELCIPEASWRDGADLYYTVPQDLLSLARPHRKTDITYSYLEGLISEAISDRERPSSSKFQSSLLFESDPNYVPMEYTIGEIDEAFKKSCVVVLYGDSGTGKSSLARHYALRFEKAMKRSNDGQSSSPVACYVDCGPGVAVQEMHMEILRTFDIQMAAPQQDFQAFGIKESDAQKLKRLHIAFIQNLKGRDALLVLDDIRDRSLLEKLLVPGLKCLITTRDGNLWSDPNAESIRIQSVDMEDGRKIFSAYAKFENVSNCIPQEFQFEADMLIEHVQRHPLALATLGTVMRSLDKSDPQEWVDLRRSLLLYLESENYRCTNYPITVSAALMLVVNEKFLGEDALYLLYVINLFEGPKIPESLVKSFLALCRPTALKRLHMDIQDLKALSLVQITRSPLYLLFAMDPNREAVFDHERDRDGGTLYHRYFYIHDLRQSFILKQKKLNKVTGFLRGNREFYLHGKRSDHDWATVLCAISGVSSVKEEAEQKMGDFYKWNLVMQNQYTVPVMVEVMATDGLLSIFLAEMLTDLPGGIKGQKSKDNTSDHILITCTEIIWTFLIHCRIDENNVSALLKKQDLDLFNWTLQFLTWSILLYIHNKKTGVWEHQLSDGPMLVSGCVDFLISVLSSSAKPMVQERVLICLSTFAKSYWSVNTNSEKLLDGLIKGNLLSKENFLSKEKRLICKASLILTKNLTYFPWTVVKFLDCLDKLVELFAEDVAVDLQEDVLSAIYIIVAKNNIASKLVELFAEGVAVDLQEDVLSPMNFIVSKNNITALAAHNSNLFLKFIPFLSQDLGDRRRGLTLKIVRNLLSEISFAVMAVGIPNCLQKLIELLVEGVDADMQEDALLALDAIAGHYSHESPIIFNALSAVSSDLLLRIVTFLSPDLGERCTVSVYLLASLAKECSSAVMIVMTPNCLHKLVKLLVEDAAADLVEHALLTLLRLLEYRVPVSDGSDSDIILAVFATISSDLVLRIVQFLSQDVGVRCRLSLRLLIILAKECTFAATIIKTPNCLQKLTTLLVEDAAADLVEHALSALCSILDYGVPVSDGSDSDIILTVFATIKIVQFLSEDLEGRCMRSVHLLMRLAEERSCALVIINTPDCLQKLVELLAEDVAADIQGRALKALYTLEITTRDDADLNPSQISVRDVIQNNMNNICPKVCATLYRNWYLRNAMRGAYPAALRDITRALELESTNGCLWQERGVCRRLMNDYSGALEDLDRALEIDIDDYECLKHRALVKFLLGNEEGASADAERAMLIKPSRVDDNSYGKGCLGVLPVEFLTYKLK